MGAKGTVTARGATTLPSASSWAVPFLGVLGAIQGAAPNIASTALVGASRGLHMAGGTLALASSVATLSTAATVISTGLLADRLGRRRVLMVGLLIAALGDLMVALAPTTSTYLLGRAIAGVGLGAVFGAAFAYIRAVAKPGKLPAAVGIFSAVIGLTSLVLTFVGGSLAGIDWRLAFLVAPAMSLVCFVLVPLVLPKEARVVGTSTDALGQVLLIVGIIAFLYGVSELGRSLTSPRTLLSLLAGAVIIGAFFVHESRDEHRFFPVSLFRSPMFLAAICAGFIYNFGQAVAFLQVTNLWQYVNGLKTAQVALWQLPLTGAGIVAALIVGRMMTRGMTNRSALLAGTAITAAGFVFLAALHGSTNLVGFLPGLVLVGAGVITCAVPYGNLIIEEAPPKYFGPVTSSRTTIGQFFFAIGFSISTVAIDKLTVGGTLHRLSAAGVPPTQTSTGLDAVTAYAAKSTAPTTSLGHQALGDALVSYGNAFAVMMLIAAAVCVLAGVVGFYLPRREGESSTTTEPAPAAAAA